MIRINLLGLKKDVPKGGGAPTITMEGAKLTAMFVVIIALGVVALVGHWYMLTAENTKLTKELQDAQAEKTRLATAKTQYEQFEKQRQFLERRQNIITSLKSNQSGPVTLLNTIASTVSASEQLWLTSFTNDGPKVEMDGVAGNVNTVADFIAHLKSTGQFKTIEIRESSQSDAFRDIPTFTFSISAELKPPAPATASGSGGAAGAAGGATPAPGART